ncbi:MAG: FMN-binding negative transcriptional regulator [Marinomonas sp.]
MESPQDQGRERVSEAGLMHPNSAFRGTDPEFRPELVGGNMFAAIFLQTPMGPKVAHAPLYFSGPHTAQFHLAKNNTLTPYLDGAQALAVINGPDDYISARWYAADNQVPTWNYVAFEFEGIAKRVEEEKLPDLLANLSAEHEDRITSGLPWTMDKMDYSAVRALLRGIVGFEMSDTSVRETIKLSQNKPVEERQRIIDGLEAEGSTAMVKLMQAFQK